MDSYFPKTRRPIVGLSGSLKRPASDATTPPKPAKIPATPTTPKDARLHRPLLPPPVKRKSELQVEAATRQRASADKGLRSKPLSVRELFKSARPLSQQPQRKATQTSTSLATRLSTSTTTQATPLATSNAALTAPLATPLLFDREPVSLAESTAATTTTTTTTTTAAAAAAAASRLGLVELRVPTPPSTPIKTTKQAPTFPTSPIKTGSASIPVSPNKITSGPLKGVSTSLLDLIRAKEAAAKAVTPEQKRQRELLGIAPAIVRIVPTVFTANKKEVMPYDKVVEKCFKGLKSNYTTQTIIECIDLLDKVTPEWISTVKISRGQFMRINREKYTIAQLLEAIKRYKTKNC